MFNPRFDNTDGNLGIVSSYWELNDPETDDNDIESQDESEDDYE